VEEVIKEVLSLQKERFEKLKPGGKNE